MPYPGSDLPSARPPVGTNKTAIASLAVSLGGLLLWPVALGGIALGTVALGQVRKTGEDGRGLAVAGIAIGVVLVALGMYLRLFVTPTG